MAHTAASPTWLNASRHDIPGGLQRHGNHSSSTAWPAAAAAPSQRKSRQPRCPPILAATTDALLATTDALFGGVQAAVLQHPALYTLEFLLLGAAAYASAVWPNRPRGWCFNELLAVRSSSVAGRGVFAVMRIQEGTVLGCYPGRPRTPQGMADKCATAPAAAGYCFKTTSGLLLDPTDASGRLSTAPGPGPPWLPTDCTLAYINEPPKGAGGTNVTVEDDPSDALGLLCVAVRDIEPGEELYMDYGITYDRSAYSRQHSSSVGSSATAAGGSGGGDSP